MHLCRIGDRIINLGRMTKACVDAAAHAVTLHLDGGGTEKFGGVEADHLLVELANANRAEWDERIAPRVDLLTDASGAIESVSLLDQLALWAEEGAAL